MHRFWGIILLLAPCAVFAQSSESALVPSPPTVTSFRVDRYVEHPLSDYQTKIMNEATKLSLACRLFRYFYGRWPADFHEISEKSTGIDLGVFLGRALVTPLDNDAAKISIFDGENMREVVATPIDFGMSSSQVRAAHEPGFKIDIPRN